MMKKYFCAFLFALTVFLQPCVALAETPAAEQATDSLPLVKKNLHGELRLDAGANWSKFTQIKLEKATVEFSENWARDQRSRSGNLPTEENMGRIKSELSELLDDVFKQQLTKDDIYTITDTDGENVMLITPRIVNLNIYAPDRMRNYIGFTLADSKGNMTLELEVHDSVSGALLARIIDSRQDPGTGHLEWTTSGNNRQAARFMFIRWAEKLRDLLIETSLTTPD